MAEIQTLDNQITFQGSFIIVTHKEEICAINIKHVISFEIMTYEQGDIKYNVISINTTNPDVSYHLCFIDKNEVIRIKNFIAMSVLE
jgi:hypothetical protein